MRLISLLIAIFVVFEIIGLYIAKEFRDNEIDEILKNSAEITHVLYNSILNSFESRADLIYDNVMEDRERIEEILYLATNSSPEIDNLRNELLSLLTDKYRYLKTKYDIRQIHFHLPQGISFLRMHKPSKFGDSLWSARPSIREVNNKKEVIRGFEEGRIFNGFRNIYPLFKDGIYIGSVEISFSFQSIRSQAMRLLPFHYKFMISNKSVNVVWKDFKKTNYVPTDLCEDFFYDVDAEAHCEHPKHTEEFIGTLKQVNSLIADDVKSRLERFEKFAKFVKYKDKFFTVSFIPISSVGGNKAAYFISYEEHNKFIEKEFNNMERRVLIFTLVLILSLTLIYLFIVKELEIRKLNKNLEKRIADEIAKSRQKDKIILQQSKLTAMAEMINSIAHQWRQPLNRISLEVINIEEDFVYNELNEENLHKYSEGINSNLQYLSKTIDDFRDFYRHRESSETVDIVSVIDSSIYLIESEIDQSIKLEFISSLKEEFLIEYGEEFKQVVINILTNAIESVKSKESTDGAISVYIEESDQSVVILIVDNGKGISDEVADRIFEPYFTTKFEHQGTGMGLYVSKITIEINMGGKIGFYNNQFGGTTFKIELPK